MFHGVIEFTLLGLFYILFNDLQGFWRFLLQKNLTRDWLNGVNYAVFGLGDSSYQKYNVMNFSIDGQSY